MRKREGVFNITTNRGNPYFMGVFLLRLSPSIVSTNPSRHLLIYNGRAFYNGVLNKSGGCLMHVFGNILFARSSPTYLGISFSDVENLTGAFQP
jgi:hypothetical protein